ncbi:hypothetical protein [Companilactobacillus nuruki]|uniref:Uncharacterized protein n=1 Tax=Companilactobacillus nuruki TaxID=1993540 RepID=A0A2N7ATY1_9LACO|nr:hypothetical protein [Companilactobacillus nuruki]PMD70246.1 hypothetical protein CBP76_07070 [Companilactobacillus nuruki]
MKIAVQLDDNKNIIGTVTTNELGAELQVKLFKDKGWTLVDSDPTFSIDNKYQWTVRESDNKLVHVSTGKTPDEETKDAITSLTQQNLDGKLTDAQVQSAITSLTKQNLQLTQDNVSFKSAITSLTQQIADLKTSNTSTETTTK